MPDYHTIAAALPKATEYTPTNRVVSRATVHTPLSLPTLSRLLVFLRPESGTFRCLADGLVQAGVFTPLTSDVIDWG